MSRWEAQHSERVDASIEAVRALWANPENWRCWNPDIVRLQTSGPLELGSTARVRLRGSPPMTFVVTNFERGRCFTDEALVPGARLGHEHRLTPRASGVEVTHALYYDGPWPGCTERSSRGDFDVRCRAS